MTNISVVPYMQSTKVVRRACLLLLAVVVMSVGAADVTAQDSERVPSVHVVERGETLYRIARENGLTVRELQRLNELEGTTIRVGQRLVVGYDTSEDREPSNDISLEEGPADSANASTTFHTARPGDTFYSIAAHYSISADTLFALNEWKVAPLEPGQPVVLPEAFGPTVHRVASDETLLGIAQAYGLSVDALRSVNRLPSDTVHVGQEFRIPARRSPPSHESGRLPTADTTAAIARYPDAFEGRLTSSGTPYDPERYLVSHPSLPFGTVVLLTDTSSGRRTFATVADRGPLDPSYLLDVSDAVAEALGVEDRASGIQIHVVR